MSIETGVVVGLDGEPIYWHLPADRSAAHLGDSRDLWDVFWINRHKMLGFAHSHPGRGIPGPSWTDITTFKAVESALGRQVVWWICSETHIVAVRQLGKSDDWVATPFGGKNMLWLPKLREHSYGRSRLTRSIIPMDTVYHVKNLNEKTVVEGDL